MADQEIVVTMHTLNKYGVPCIDVTDYITRSGGGSGDSDDPLVFYLQKSPASMLMFSQMKSLKYTKPDPLDPITGIEGFDYCVFVNDSAEFGSTGYVKYYSLGSGALKATIPLPCMVGNGLTPSVDIDSSYVVYDGVESESEPAKYNRFIRQGDGSLVMNGRLSFERGFYSPNSYLLLGTTGIINPIDIRYSNISTETDEFLVANEIPEGTIGRLVCSGTPPSPLVDGNYYYFIEVTEQSFKLSLTSGGTAIDLTTQGTGTNTFTFSGYTGYDNAFYFYDTIGLRASNIINDEIYINVFGEERQTGRFYKEALPDLSEDSDTKRICTGYQDLFVGDLDPDSDYVTQVEYSTFLPDEYPNKDQYTFLVNVFNDSVDDGSGEYTIGSGQIQGVWCDKNFKILLTFDDVRGDSGNQAYQKWYSYSGQFLFIWKYTTYEYEGTNYFYGLAGRIFHGNYMFVVVVNEQTKTSYLYKYYMGFNATPSICELDNPYKEEQGYYMVTNLQIIDDQYLMVNLSDSTAHCVFFKAYSPQLGIVGELTVDWSYDQQQGYRVVPKIGSDEPLSTTNTVLLQLCNDIRNRKMTWATNQVQVCQDHANWCVSHSVLQHEGPVPGEDAETSLRNRNNAKGIYGGVAENITLVIEADDETEQTNAFDAWYNSERHLENIVRDGNKYMSSAWALYPSSVTQITVGPGFTDGSGNYTTEETIFEIPEHLRGKYKIYVQNFIWY